MQEEKLTKLAKHPQYSLEATRLSSYSQWPSTCPQNPLILCDAGLFYTGMTAHAKKSHMSRLMTKPTKAMNAQRRLKSAWTSTQSDQSLCCALSG